MGHVQLDGHSLQTAVAALASDTIDRADYVRCHFYQLSKGASGERRGWPSGLSRTEQSPKEELQL